MHKNLSHMCESQDILFVTATCVALFILLVYKEKGVKHKPRDLWWLMVTDNLPISKSQQCCRTVTMNRVFLTAPFK